MRICVLGQGYVGLPLALRAAAAGHTVTGYEPDRRRCESLAAGSSYIEDIGSNRLRDALSSGAYIPTSDPRDLKGFDVAVITVPTPLTDRAPDLSCVREAGELLGALLEPGATVVLESTTYPGTTRDVLIPLLEQGSGLVAGRDFHVGFSPERIDPGNSAWTLENTPKIVAGLTESCLARVKAFYDSVTEVTVPASGLEEAELAKVFENTYRHVNIALVNELSRMAHTLGVDVWHTLDLAATKPFGFAKFLPGPGVGGHCLPIDPVYLSHHVKARHGQTFRLIELAQDINESQPDYVVRRLQDALNRRFRRSVHGARILALGAAYKPGTADARQSPAVQVIDRLRAMGADVTVVDPYLSDGGSTSIPFSAGTGADTGVGADTRAGADTEAGTGVEADTRTGAAVSVADFDAVVLLTSHGEFDLARVASEAAYVLDTRGVMERAPHVERL
ncbi:nucleotide sugar dehydrogenase [Streptomyces sp. V3I7]|uniref:nucleotide sugar dehydrogenase n=1 Tax=Streptomyces sp. V3I7 TaxID=3042278 RepID=UPI002785C1D0|nr:nucleotide sugar dehydrogenase [Streptomyces sp. V3I7]MDQ0991619.1 UDP-N-acetyl-D-glucosamine dehydrogenase [Streptomyces sp. V3I7]